mgnify:CR=1 FL=1
MIAVTNNKELPMARMIEVSKSKSVDVQAWKPRAISALFGGAAGLSGGVCYALTGGSVIGLLGASIATGILIAKKLPEDFKQINWREKSFLAGAAATALGTSILVKELNFQLPPLHSQFSHAHTAKPEQVSFVNQGIVACLDIRPSQDDRSYQAFDMPPACRLTQK